jgi:WD40 repeat protein
MMWQPAPDLMRRPTSPDLTPAARVSTAAFSPDGKVLLIATTWTRGVGNGTGRFVDAATGKPLGLPFYQSSVAGDHIACAAYSPDGKKVATGTTGGKVQLWSVPGGEALGLPLPHEGRLLGVAFSPDGEKIATTCDHAPGFHLWEAATGKPLSLPEIKVGARVVAFSPDGKKLVMGDEVWDLAPGKQPRFHLWQDVEILAAVFSPDGKHILTGNRGGHALIFDAATGRHAGPVLAHPGAVNAVAFSPDGRTALTGSEDGTARAWDVATGKPLGPPLPHSHPVQSVAFSPDGKAMQTATGVRLIRPWPTPVPGQGDMERIAVWAQVITGLEWKDQQVIPITYQRWQKSHGQLRDMGGPPLR